MNHVTFRTAYKNGGIHDPNTILVAGCGKTVIRAFPMWEWMGTENNPGYDSLELCILKSSHAPVGVTALLVYKCRCGRRRCTWSLPFGGREDPEDVLIVNWDRVKDGTIALASLPPTFAIIQN